MAFFIYHIYIFFYTNWVVCTPSLGLLLGLIGVGLSLLLFGLTTTKRWKGYGELRPISWFFRLIVIGLSYLLFYFGYQFYIDVQYFIEGNYETVEGVPSEIINFEMNRELVETITVVVDNEYFDLVPKPKYYIHIEDLEQKTFVIYYLPKTKWVIDYEDFMIKYPGDLIPEKSIPIFVNKLVCFIKIIYFSFGVTVASGEVTLS